MIFFDPNQKRSKSENVTLLTAFLFLYHRFLTNKGTWNSGAGAFVSIQNKSQ